MPDKGTIDRLSRLFRGLERAHGVAKPTGRKNERGKAETKYQTLHTPVEISDWEKHVAGEAGLVVIPIRDDANVLFGAIDIDVYPLDTAALSKKVQSYDLPLVMCRTKSGGVHLYLFLSEPTSAEVVQKKLTDWAVLLGYPRAEVFPKQIQLASTNDTGNGINAPYFGKETTRYAIGVDGKALSIEEFVSLAESKAVSQEDLPDVKAEVHEDMEGAPPCVQHWARVGVSEGQRNDVMFDFAVFAKKRWPDKWREKFEDMNRQYCHPPLPSPEVVAIIGSVGKQKDYTYKSKCEGPYCNPRLCRKSEHGRGTGYDDPGVNIDGLTVVMTDPRTFIVAVNGRRVQMDSGTFRNQKKFSEAVFERLIINMHPMKPKAWDKLKDQLLANKEVVEAPDDASPAGQLHLHLAEFFDRFIGKTRDELRIERCWTDDLSGRTYFRSKDFANYLKRQRVAGYKERDIYILVRDLGGGNELISAGNEKIRCWWVPRKDKKSDQLPVPPVSGVEAPF